MDISIDLLIEIPSQPSLMIVSPGTFSELLSKISSSASKPESSISLLYNRKGSWFKIADNTTYISILKKTAAQGSDEIEMKVDWIEEPHKEEWDLMSDLSRIVPNEEFKVQEPVFDFIPAPVVQEKFSLYYRYLNSSKHDQYIGITLENFEITMKELSDIIVLKENLATADWVCAFYSEEGSPITGTLSQMSYQICSSLLTFGLKLMVFIVPNFDIKSFEKIAPAEGQDTLTFQCASDENITFTFKIDISTAKVVTLKQILYHFTDIPTFEQRLKTADSYLSRNDAMLSEYQLASNQKIIYDKVNPEYSTFSYKHHNKQSVQQSNDGIRFLHSFLHTFGKVIEISEKPIRESLLGYVRQFTYNCTPYISALYRLSKGKNLSVLSSVALEEGTLILVRTVTKDIFKENIEGDKIFEHVIDVYGLLCDLSCNQSEELSRDEVFKEFDIVCPLTQQTLKEPVLIKRTDLKVMYYEKEELVKKFKADEEVKFVVKVKEEELKVDENFKFNVKRSFLNGYDTIYIWEGIYDTTKTIGQLVAEKYPQGINLTKAQDLKRAYKITKPVPPLSLKSTDNRDCMTYNKSKELVISLGPSNKEPNKVDLMNILTRSVQMIDIDDLASAIEMRNPTQIGQEVITRNPDEAIVVVFDVSGSMGTRFFDDQDFTRLDATKEFFETFTDRTAGFDFSHVISLLLFSTSMTRACGFTENVVTFSSHIQNAGSGGGTKLWDALSLAIDYLKEFKNTYSNAHLRILCLSDGEDTSSTNNYVTISKSLVSYNITMDSIVVGALSQQLKAASFASGGYVFMPKTIPEGVNMFQAETFLSFRARTVPTRTLVNTEADLIPLLSKDFTNSQPVSAALPQEISAKSSSMKATIAKLASNPPPASKSGVKGSVGGAALKRITKELQELESNPHPSFTVYPTENDVTFWNVYMLGPETTPYEGGIFQIYVKLPSDYPFKPPSVKFLTRIYHCNINSNGSICHAILKDQWSPALTLRKVFDCLYGLLLTPEPLDPLDPQIATEYRVDYDLFFQKATEFTKKYATAVVPQSSDHDKTIPPPQFLCGITGNLMTDPVMVVKSNNSYERSEIERVVDSTGKEPKTGEDITRADLVTNVALMLAIQEFNKMNASGP